MAGHGLKQVIDQFASHLDRATPRLVMAVDRSKYTIIVAVIVAALTVRV